MNKITLTSSDSIVLYQSHLTVVLQRFGTFWKCKKRKFVQIFELFYRPDSIHGDDDEDRIPEELLLKYTKTDDDLLPVEFPVETNNEEKEIANVIIKIISY